MRVVFFGSPEFAVPSLRAIADRHDVVAVVSQPDRPAGRGGKLQPPAVKVLANRAEEILGGKKGEYKLVNPNDHPNYGQSTNDTFPSAMRIMATPVSASPRIIDH